MISVHKTDTIYSTAVDWWKGHNFPNISRDMLPETAIVSTNKEGDKTHMMFLYHTDSNLCWIAFPISNPKLSRDSKKGNLASIMKGAVAYCKELGFKYIFTTSPITSVQEKLIDAGFQTGDKEVNHYIKVL